MYKIISGIAFGVVAVLGYQSASSLWNKQPEYNYLESLDKKHFIEFERSNIYLLHTTKEELLKNNTSCVPSTTDSGKLICNGYYDGLNVNIEYGFNDKDQISYAKVEVPKSLVKTENEIFDIFNQRYDYWNDRNIVGDYFYKNKAIILKTGDKDNYVIIYQPKFAPAPVTEVVAK